MFVGSIKYPIFVASMLFNVLKTDRRASLRFIWIACLLFLSLGIFAKEYSQRLRVYSLSEYKYGVKVYDEVRLSIGPATYFSDVFLVHGFAFSPSVSATYRKGFSDYFSLSANLSYSEYGQITERKEVLKAPVIGASVNAEIPFAFYGAPHISKYSLFFHVGLGGYYHQVLTGNKQTKIDLGVPIGLGFTYPLNKQLRVFADANMVVVGAAFDGQTYDQLFNGLFSLQFGLGYIF